MESGHLLMLADIAKLENEERPILMAKEEDAPSLIDAVDHEYLSRNDFDRLVNSTHDYYQRIGQCELDDREHSYAFQIPHQAGKDSESLWNEDFPQSVSSSYINGIELNPYSCEWGQCSFGAQSTGELEEHIRTHLVQGTRLCEWKGCSKQKNMYSHRYLLRRHLLSHLGIKPFSCNYCCRCFTTSERKRLHIRAIHESEVKYKCEVCDQFFKTTAERCHHVTRVHMKERIICPHCNRLYAGRTVLLRHLKVCSMIKK